MFGLLVLWKNHQAPNESTDAASVNLFQIFHHVLMVSPRVCHYFYKGDGSWCFAERPPLLSSVLLAAGNKKVTQKKALNYRLLHGAPVAEQSSSLQVMSQVKGRVITPAGFPIPHSLTIIRPCVRFIYFSDVTSLTDACDGSKCRL